MRCSRMFGRVVVAAVLAAAMGASVAAQSYNAIDSGGPLWWFPENDGSYSRHHDRWYISRDEALDGDWEVATSFPTTPRDKAWETHVSGAPPNSACDVQNGTERINVGPPHDDTNVPEVRTVRTPSGAGGFAGLQMSLHIGEWWQGMKYRGYYDDPLARAEHFSGPRASYDPLDFGWFDVRMQDGSGAVLRPPLYDGGHSVTWINPVFSQWQLHGGGGFAMPCLGISMVQMHGVEDGGRDQVWPPTPVGADGGECWSSARALVLRANSEARCEPNLAERYAYTVRFWALFDAEPPRPAPPWIGGSHLPLFPSDYAAPYLMARRGEVAVFTVSELARTAAPPVPWAPLRYPGRGAAAGATRPGLQARFLDPNRVDPFGGASYGAGTVSLPLQGDADPNARECIELGEPGWDAANGTLAVDCGHGRENSPTTGHVNRAVMGYGAAERSLEAGPVDNSTLFGGVAVARRPGVVPWAPPAGFSWFEHGNATLACLFLEGEVDSSLPAQAEASRQAKMDEVARQFGIYTTAAVALANCGANPLCIARALAIMAAARAGGLRAFREAYGWEIILDYREEVIPGMAAALGAARPYGYATPRQVLRAAGRVLPDGCVTSVGGGAYNEALIPSYPTFERGSSGTRWAAQSTIPGQGGPMWYGPAFDGYGAHAAGDRGDHYTQFADVVGRTTPYSEAELPPGVDYPEEMRRYAKYNDVRIGSTVWRDFACKTAHGGYYGMGLTALGPTSESHRSTSPGPGQPDRWWKEADPDVSVGDFTPTQYSSGTPCVNDPAYDARGADGTRRCFELISTGRPTLSGVGQVGCQGGDCSAGGLGAYSTPASPTGHAGFYMLEYSGDGTSDAGRPGSVGAMRPTSYRMLDGSEMFVLDLRSSFFNLRYGYRSLDVERVSIWSGYGPWSSFSGGKGSSWLLTGESYEGVAPGWCSGGGCDSSQVPMDWGRLEHQGPLAWYGATVPGGTGGCMLSVDRAGGVAPGENPQGSVLEEPQRITCLLPIDAGPDGRCPGENLP